METILHDEAKRTNIPTAEYRSVMDEADQSPIEVAYQRRNRDLDPQLVWRAKDEQDRADFVVQAPPLYIQDKVHPKVLIDDLMKRTERSDEKQAASSEGLQPNLFSDFNGLPEGAERTEFYQHDAKLVQPHDPRRQPAGDGVAGRARGPAWQGPMHLHRPAVRHQVQLQLPSGRPPAAT